MDSAFAGVDTTQYLCFELLRHCAEVLSVILMPRLINEALTADESGEKQAAISAYQKALQKLTNAISACKGNESMNEMKCKMERCVE